MSKESSQQNSRLIKIRLLPRLTILYSLISGIIFIALITILQHFEKQDFDNWLNKSMFSSLDAISNIYASANNDEYDIEYIWGKVIEDFEKLGLLENNLSTEDLNILKQNLNTNLEKTILASFSYFIRNQRFEIKGYPFVISQTGDVIIHPTDEGKNYADYQFFQNVISSNNDVGVLQTQWPENRLGEKRKVFFKINKEYGYISFVSLNQDDYTTHLKQYKNKSIIFGISIYVLLIFLFIFIVNPIILKIKNQSKNLQKLYSNHDLESTKSLFSDELTQTEEELVEGQSYLNKLHGFINQLKEQNYDTSVLKNSNEKLLANDLLGLTEELVKIQSEENKRKEELDTQHWSATGLAKFNDVLRKSNNLQEMGYDIVSSLCDYMEINQAAIYITERNERTNQIEAIKLIAAYAFDRHRTVEKTLTPGEGLVGAAIKETKSIYLDKIPEDYINITSGLGEASPSHLFIIPLKKEDIILGALELASFSILKDHEIDFLERLSETFAISISNILVSDNTNKLLNETKEQAELMASQEEEMRQTLEELQATQEEMQRKTKQMEEMNRQHEDKEKELESTIAGLNKVIDQQNQELDKLKN